MSDKKSKCMTCARKDSGFNCLHFCKDEELSAYLPADMSEKTIKMPKYMIEELMKQCCKTLNVQAYDPESWIPVEEQLLSENSVIRIISNDHF